METNKSKIVGFKSAKAAQIAAFFAQSHIDPIDKLKLSKLMYLAERESLNKFGYPMIYDEFYSIKHGPICSGALNGIDGNIDRDIWASFITLDGKQVRPTKNITRDILDEVSDAEYDVLKTVMESFGWMTTSQLREYTHKHIPEYTEVSEGRIPISYGDVFKALNIEEAEELEAEISQYRRTTALLTA